jgi:EpsI family protein
MIDRRFAAVLSLLVATAILSAMSERRPPESLARPLDAIPSQLGAWRTTGQETLGAEILNVLKPTSYLSRFYQANEKHLGLFIAFYDRQTAGATLHSPKNCLPGSGWEIWKQSSLAVPLNSGQVTVNRYSIRNADNKMLIYYWYQSRDRIVASEFAGKLFLVRDSLSSGHTAAALVRITLPDSPSSDQEAVSFASLAMPQIEACFGR